MNKNINKYLDIQKRKVTTKVSAEIILNIEEYKNISEELSEDNDLQVQDKTENNDTLVINIPGFFEILFPENMDSIKFSLPYDIQIYKHNIIESTSKILHLSFLPGETVFSGSIRNTQSNIRILNSLLENGIKYLNNDIYQTVLSTYEQLAGMSNIPMSHIELLISQLYSTKVNNEFVPLRYSNKEYKKEYAIGTKKATHRYANNMGFSYGYTNDFILNDLSKTKKKDNSFFENIISGDYDKLRSPKEDT